MDHRRAGRRIEGLMALIGVDSGLVVLQDEQW